MRRARVVAWALALALAAAPSPSRADEQLDKARPFFDAGAAAYAAGDFAAAAQAFSEAYALAPRPQLLFSLAQAERRQYTAQHQPQDLADAMKHFRLYLDQVPQGGRRADAVEALAELEAAAARAPAGAAPVNATRSPQKTRVMVSPSVKDAVVTLDGAAHAEAPVIEEVEPGKHHIKVTAKGYFDDERDVTSVEGTLVAIEVALKEQPARIGVRAMAGAEVAVDGRPYGTAPLLPIELPAGAHTVTFTKTGHRPVVQSVSLERGASITVDGALRDTRQRTAAYVVLGVGVAAVVAGASLSVVAVAKQRNAQAVLADASRHTILQSELDAYGAAHADRDRLRAASVASFGAAAALGVTGAALYVFDNPTPQREDLGAPRVAVVPVAGGAAVVVGGRFY